MVDEESIIGIYLGEANKSFTRYYDLAVRNIDFKFYHSFDSNLKKEIYENYNVNLPEKDSFVIIRKETNFLDSK